MPDVRARSNAELLDAAFEIYRRHFLTMATIAVIGLAPVTLARLFAPTPGARLVIVPVIVYIVAVIAGTIFSFFVDAALIAATGRAYFGEPVDVGEAWGAGLAHPGRVLRAVLAKGAWVVLGLILFVIPGIIMLIRYFAVPATVVLEDQSAEQGMRRSRELADGNKRRIFILLGASWLFYIFVAAVAGGLVGVTAAGSPVVAALVNLLIGGAVYPIIPIVTTLLYYDLRIRKEGYDIELMAESMTVPSVA